MYDFAVKARARPQGSTSPRSGKVERRRERRRAALLAAGARQFARRGIDSVSVAEVLADAAVSRASFYEIFYNKYSFLEDILHPIFDIATRAIRELSARPLSEAVDGLVEVYWSLWSSHRDGLLPIHDAVRGLLLRAH